MAEQSPDPGPSEPKPPESGPADKGFLEKLRGSTLGQIAGSIYDGPVMHGNAELANVLFTGQGFTIYGNHTADAPNLEQQQDQQPDQQPEHEMDDDFEP